jgi:hypothetical protein
VSFGLDRLAELPVERFDRVGIRYERRLDAVVFHELARADEGSGLLSTVRSSGMRDIRKQTHGEPPRVSGGLDLPWLRWSPGSGFGRCC